jgi:protein SCO1
MRHALRNIFMGLSLALTPTFAWGLSGVGPASDRIGGTVAPGYVPPALMDVGITEKLGQQVPLETVFTDDSGKQIKLADIVGDKPVVLQLGYFECPMLCGLVAEGWVKSIQGLKRNLGEDYQVISISVDSKESHTLAAKKKDAFLKGLAKPINSAGVHYLVGDEAAIKAVTDATGFGYKWVPSAGEFSHPAAIIVLTPQGKVSQYLYGIEYPADQLASAIETANAERTQSSFSQFVMTCFQMTDGAGQIDALKIMRIAGAVTVVLLAGVVFTLIRREGRLSAASAVGNESA